MGDTGHGEAGPGAQSILRGLIRLYENAFPGRLRAVYLLGSRAEGGGRPASDIDGCILFKGTFHDPTEARRARRVLDACRLISPLRLDLEILAEDDPAFRKVTEEDARLKLGAHLVHGDDIRDRLPLPSLDAYRRFVARWPERFIKLVHDLETLVAPLEYPHPEDEFFGYQKVRLPLWYPQGVTEGTKELVSAVLWTAAALLAFEAGQYSTSRGDCLRLSRQYLDADCVSLVEEAHHRCTVEWSYRVPEDPEDRLWLRRFCERAHGFMNDYVERYANPAQFSPPLP